MHSTTRQSFLHGIIFAFLVLATNLEASAEELQTSNSLSAEARAHLSGFSTQSGTYHDEALKMLIGEANQVTKKLHLEERVPIIPQDIVESYICSEERARITKAIGMIATKHHAFYVSKEYKFCYCEDLNQESKLQFWKLHNRLPKAQIDTNGAYLAAVQALDAVSMDVNALKTKCEAHIIATTTSGNTKDDYCVPVYWIYWKSSPQQEGSVASVQIFLPTKEIVSLRVEDPAYILRAPLEIKVNSALTKSPTAIVK